jgi:hypothetical protein
LIDGFAVDIGRVVKAEFSVSFQPAQIVSQSLQQQQDGNFAARDAHAANRIGDENRPPDEFKQLMSLRHAARLEFDGKTVARCNRRIRVRRCCATRRRTVAMGWR